MWNLGKWAQPGDAVICSGYPFHTHMDLLYDALQELYAAGAVALCIKPVRNKPFSPELIALANSLNLLVVELPREACVRYHHSGNLRKDTRHQSHNIQHAANTNRKPA